MAWQFGDYRLDPKGFELALRGETVHAEPQVLELIIHLVRHRSRMVSKDEIANTIWPDRIVSDASISSRIRSARQALGDDGRNQALIRTIHGKGFRFVAEVTETAPAQPIQPSPAADKGELSRPSVAVLPFRPLGAAPDLAILAEAIPHEIIQALSRLRWLAVIARGSSFRFRQSQNEPELVGTALGAGYVLSGVIEGLSGAVAVAIELVDAVRGEVIWGDRLTAPIEGIEDLRQRITTHVVTALDLHVPQNEVRLAIHSGAERLDAWKTFHLGLSQLYRFTPEANQLAKGHFHGAIRLDPQFARAHAGLSFTRFIDAFLHLGPDSGASAMAARTHAERGLELDPLDPFTHYTMGRSYWLADQPEIAAGWFERAIELNPNYAQGFYASAFTALMIGDIPKVDTGLDAALGLSPLDPLLYGIRGVRAQALIQTGDTAAAARLADRAASTPGAHYLISMIAAAANGLDGRQQQASRWREDVLRRKPDASVAQYFAAFPIRDKDTRDRITGELTRQGF
ncbi:winged helix-turn-helix domain-containing tetratricopeptide repeat protein [Pararhodobacter oceanensis]|uniref:Transcriptional regulator n=1 Tax=Pararhodobacter oceanensis TaxID=2172121 RepID=A0A2T8HQU8_9RHOB|nr:winged helix-turn-helix domain-containing protein [Pararhodobacter oceanensis]PVH27804.1 transcriptional regulator [Pararhodobacter oceanensis]